MIETKTANLYIKNDISFIIYKKNADVGVDEIEENLNIKTELQNKKAMRTLVDVRDVWQYTDEAKKVLNSENFKRITIAMAVVVGYSLPIKIIANFFMRLNKPDYPTKLFSNYEEGIKWLKEIEVK